MTQTHVDCLFLAIPLRRASACAMCRQSEFKSLTFDLRLPLCLAPKVG